MVWRSVFLAGVLVALAVACADRDGTSTTTETGGSSSGQGTETSTGTSTTGDGDGDPNTCAGMDQSCAAGETCCATLVCCEGPPVPPGQEYCSDVCPMSDRNLKTGFEDVDPQRVLDQVVQLPISTWRYKSGSDGHARHIGPMAQDFQAAFGVGHSDRFIFQVDADGVSLAAIQALDANVRALEAENAQLRASVQLLERRLAKLEQ